MSKVTAPNGKRIQMRIGIHTGTLVAGCIGTQALRYDIYGNDAMVANAFESGGTPGQICVSNTTHRYIFA